MCAAMRDKLGRQMFEVAIQAAASGKVVARETLKVCLEPAPTLVLLFSWRVLAINAVGIAFFCVCSLACKLLGRRAELGFFPSEKVCAACLTVVEARGLEGAHFVLILVVIACTVLCKGDEQRCIKGLYQFQRPLSRQWLARAAGLPQERDGQVLRRRREPQAQAAGAPEGGQEAHAPRGHRGRAAGGVPCAHARLAKSWSSPQKRIRSVGTGDVPQEVFYVLIRDVCDREAPHRP